MSSLTKVEQTELSIRRDYDQRLERLHEQITAIDREFCKVWDELHAMRRDMYKLAKENQ